jgi:lipoate-protein ligase A
VSELRVEVVRGRAGDLHARPWPEPLEPMLWVHVVEVPAIVLGSTQPDDVVDRRACERAGIDVARRRSGGGAVLLVPGEVTWVDVVLPVGHDQIGTFGRDVHDPVRRLGGALASTIRSRAGIDVHGASPVRVASAMEPTEWSRTVCFDGLGPGEVVIDGHKAIGMSQRRSRGAVRIQCAWYRRHEPDDILELLSPAHRPPAGVLRRASPIEPGWNDDLMGVIREGSWSGGGEMGQNG